VRIEPMRMRGL